MPEGKLGKVTSYRNPLLTGALFGCRQFGGRTILTASVPEEEFFPPGEAPPAPPPIDQAADAALADILA